MKTFISILKLIVFRILFLFRFFSIFHYTSDITLVIVFIETKIVNCNFFFGIVFDNITKYSIFNLRWIYPSDLIRVKQESNRIGSIKRELLTFPISMHIHHFHDYLLVSFDSHIIIDNIIVESFRTERIFSKKKSYLQRFKDLHIQ